MSDDVMGEVQPTGLDGEQAQADVSSVESSPAPEGEQQVEQQPDEPAKPGKIPASVQKRINELTRQKHEGQRSLEHAQQEIEQYRRLLAAQQEPGQTQQQPAPQPTAGNHQDPQALAQQIVAQQQFDQACNAIYETGKASFADFDDAVAGLAVLGVQRDFLEAVAVMDNPAGVLYALSTDLDAAARIMSLPPVQQGRELERLALKVATPKAPAISKAPAPIAPVDGTAVVETDPNKMSTSDWMKWRSQQLAKKGR